MCLKYRKSASYIESRLVVAEGEGVGGGTEWEVGVSSWKILYVERIENKVLLYISENCIQYPMINHNGKEYLKRNVYICVCVCVIESLCCIAEINTTL